jgi:PAS domain S-box-containing protein
MMLPLMTPEEELRLHDRAMGASSCGITIADCRLPDMPLIYVNDAFETVTGYSVRETMGRNCRFLQIRADGTMDRDQEGVGEIRRALLMGEDCTATLRNYRKNGDLFYNELHVSPIFDASGRLTHFVGVQTDITRRVLAEETVIRERADLEKTLNELRETQAMLVHIEKMSALGQMVAGVAHEINNPISFVNSNLHSLRASMTDFFSAYDRLEGLLGSQGASIRDAAADIRAAADIDFLRDDLDDLFNASLSGLDRVKRIVQALRTFSRLDEAETKETSLRENIESTLALARAELRDRIEVVIDIEPIPDIRCHPAELNQVFLNIILNAAQAIDGKGRITIRGRDMGDHVRLEFEDTGSGMPPEIVRQIFNPFFTTKPVGQGTGLGLSIAYKIITDRHKGTITVESTPDAGSTFIITLPKDAHL